MEFTTNGIFTGNGTLIINDILTTDGTFTTNDTIRAFIAIVAFIAITYGILIVGSTFPNKYSVKRMYKNAILDIDKYFYYYQRGAEYWKLFMVHTFFSNAIRILGSTMTFITVYCAIDGNEYILLCSLITAMCQVVTMMVPIDKFVKTYVEAARIMQYELLAEHDNEIETKRKLREAFIQAEEHISKNLV